MVFDASEIFFLNQAVRLNFLTPGQRERLLAFQHEVEGGMNATTLVVEAGLMVDDEVRRVLDAIASTVREPASESISGAVTSAMIDDILATSDDQTPADRPSRESTRMAAASVRGMLGDSGPVPPNGQHTDPEPSAPQPAFPLPSADPHKQHQAFPLPGGTATEQPQAQAPASDEDDTVRIEDNRTPTGKLALTAAEMNAIILAEDLA